VTDDATARLTADVNRLLELLDLLPVPDLHDHQDFWETFALAHWAHWKPSYYVGKLAVGIEALDSDAADAARARELAEYCLIFFDGDNSELWTVLDQPPSAGRSGRRLAASLCEAAWRICVPLESARHGIGQLEGQVLGQLTEMTGREHPGGGPDDTDDNTRGTLVGQRDRGTLKGGS